MIQSIDSAVDLSKLVQGGQLRVIQSIDSTVDLAKLAAEVETLQYETDGTLVEMANWQSSGLPEQFLACPELARAVEEISKLRGQPALHLMVNKLPAGIVVPAHTDTLRPTPSQGLDPHLERWHLPISTNDGASWWDEREGMCKMRLGRWWGPVPYWARHAVRNLGLHERVHLIVDLDTEGRLP